MKMIHPLQHASALWKNCTLKRKPLLKSDKPKYFETAAGVRQGGHESPNLSTYTCIML